MCVCGVCVCVCMCVCVCVCVLFIYTYLSVLFVFYRKNLVFLHQEIYDFYKWAIFEKKIHCGKKIFDISKLFIQCNTDSCCEHITGGVNMYLYGGVSLLAPDRVVCVRVCVFILFYRRASSVFHYFIDINEGTVQRCYA